MDLNKKLTSSLQMKTASEINLVFSLKKEIYKLAQGEIVEIDGVLYRELDDGTIVEVEAEPDSYVIDAYDITFTVGEEYVNWFGRYRVLSIITL